MPAASPDERSLRARVHPLVYTIALPVVLVALVLIGFRIAYSDSALPRTKLAGVSVTGESSSQLRERLRRIARRPITVVADGRTATVTPAAAGLAFDIEATVDRVLDAGRDGFGAGVASTASGLIAGHDVDPVLAIDSAALDRAVSTVAKDVGRKPFPGAIEVDPDILEVSAVPPRSGRRLDRAALRRRLMSAFASGDDRIKAKVTVARVATRAQVERVARAAERYLAEPMDFTGIGKELQLDAHQIAPVLALSTAGPSGTVALGTGAKALKAFVDGVARRRDRVARDAEVDAPGRAEIVDGKGALSWRPKRAKVKVTRQARVGRTVDRAASAKAIDAAVRDGDHSVRLATQTTEPGLTADGARDLKFLIGTFTTAYQPGQPRVTNIRRMARTVDGTLVEPGEQFSLNGTVGPRTKAGGYVEAPFIAEGNKLEPSVGGGVSQFSTTLYNAAYFAGLKIDLHVPHSLYIDRYPAGRESTLNFPSIDLKWTNDTDSPVMIRTFTDDTSVTVSLYGDNGGRRVRAEPGARRPVPDGDFTITVTRVVRYADGHESSEPFTSRYGKPAPEEDD